MAVTLQQVEDWTRRVDVEIVQARRHTPPTGAFVPTLAAEPGRKRARIVVRQHGIRSAFCFVDLETGNILKAESFTTPAKGARGNILATNPLAGVNEYGADYRCRH